MTEQWIDIEGYEGSYQVSNLGRVKSLTRLCPSGKGGTRKCYERIMIGGKSRGYKLMLLFRDGGRKYFYVHRLVAQAFIQNPNILPQVNHKNGIKTDNRVENLEWITSSGNVRHAFDIGLKVSKRGAEDELSKETIQISLDGFLLNVFPSRREAAESVGVSVTAISQCVKGKSKKCKGYVWR